MKIREKLGKISFPGWLFLTLAVIYHEGISTCGWRMASTGAVWQR